MSDHLYWSDGGHRNPFRGNTKRDKLLDRQDLGWIILALTGWQYERREDDPDWRSYDCKFVSAFLRHCEAGHEQLCDPEIIDSMLESVWATLKDTHNECKDHFFAYGNIGWAHVNEKRQKRTKKRRCVICGEPLMCGSKKRTHDFKELSVQQCRERNIYHAGYCWHVYECQRCGHITAHDTSD